MDTLNRYQIDFYNLPYAETAIANFPITIIIKTEKK